LRGKSEKKIQKCEIPFLKAIRRMPFARENIKKGEMISFSNTKFLRSNKSKKYLDLKNIIGKKININIKKDQIINFKNLK